LGLKNKYDEFSNFLNSKRGKLATNDSRDLIEECPESTVSRGINDIANRIVKFNNKDIHNSNELLKKDTIEKFEKWYA
jgi:hypothetical protein